MSHTQNVTDFVPRLSLRSGGANALHSTTAGRGTSTPRLRPIWPG
jgi:hypothetical protein